MLDLAEIGVDRVESAIEHAVHHVFQAQRADGSWQDHLPSSAVSTGAALIALACADRERFAPLLTTGAAWLRETQRADGGWGDAVVDPGNLNGTAIAAAALQILDPTGSAGAVRRGLDFLEAHGGFDALRDRARCTLSTICLTFLAQAGLYDWQRLGHIPFELILMPQGLQRKVSFTLPGLLSWGLMQAHTRPYGPLRRAVNRIAEPRALRWLEGVQAYEQFRGGYEESPLMAAIVCFGLRRAGVGAPIAGRCREYLLTTRRPDGSWSINRDLEFSATMFLLMGLQAAGYGDDPRLGPTREWVLRSQRTAPFFPTGCPAGGWGWSLPSGWPNTDDTSSALTVLPGLGVPPGDGQLRAGVEWLLQMQHKNGAWSCFVKGGRLTLDGPCPIFTAHALIGLHMSGGLGPDHPAMQRALSWLGSVQRPDGSVHGLWYRNFTAGTAAVLEAYGVLGRAADPVAQRCRDWLLAHQHSDGSWSGGIGGEPTAEETAWALAALLAAGVPATAPGLQRAADWLVRSQLLDGSWRPSVIGVYFSSLFYSSDHLCTGYVLQALGRFWRQWKREVYGA